MIEYEEVQIIFEEGKPDVKVEPEKIKRPDSSRLKQMKKEILKFEHETKKDRKIIKRKDIRQAGKRRERIKQVICQLMDENKLITGESGIKGLLINENRKKIKHRYNN